MSTTTQKTSALTIEVVAKILTAIVLATTVPVLAWSVAQVVDLKERVARVETRERGNHEILQEIRNDIRELRNLMTKRSTK